VNHHAAPGVASNSTQSVVFHPAENRLHAQTAILHLLLGSSETYLPTRSAYV